MLSSKYDMQTEPLRVSHKKGLSKTFWWGSDEIMYVKTFVNY